MVTHKDITGTLRLLGLPSHARMAGSSEYIRLDFDSADVKEFDVWLVNNEVAGLCWELQQDEFMWHDSLNNNLPTRSRPAGTSFAPEFGIEESKAKIYNLADYRK